MLNGGGKFSLHLQRNTNIGLKHIGERLFGQTSLYLKLERGWDKPRFGVTMVNATH